MTLNELKSLKDDRDSKKKELQEAKGELKKVIDIIPLVIAGPNLKRTDKTIRKRIKTKAETFRQKFIKEENWMFSQMKLKMKFQLLALQKSI